MKVINDNIAVKTVTTSAYQSPSGLYVAPTADQEQITKGTVVAVGSLVVDVVVGDTVYFNKFMAAKVPSTAFGDVYVFKTEQVLGIET